MPDLKPRQYVGIARRTIIATVIRDVYYVDLSTGVAK